MSGASLRLTALALAMLLPSLGTSIANVALPDIAASLGATPRGAQWVVIAYLVSLTAFVIGAGRLGDVLGRRRVLLAAAVIFTAASAAAVLAQSLALLIALRAVQGAAAAGLAALSLALVGDTVTPERTGRAMGLLATVSAVGTALGPSLGGVLVEGFGWPAVFAALAATGAATLALCQTVLPRESSPRASAGLDLAGTAILPLTLAAYALTASVPASLAAKAGLAVLALAGAALFLRIEQRAKAPLLDLSLLKLPELARGLPALLLISTIVMATLVVGPFYLSGAAGLSPMAMGLVMTTGPAVAALGGRPAGALIDRHGAARIGRIGLVATLAGSAMMAVLPGLIGLAGYLAALTVITAGYALFQTANNTLVMRAAPPERRGVTSALLALARNLGLISGASVMTAVYGLASARGGDPAGLTATFAVATLLALAALALTRRPAPPRAAGPAATASSPHPRP